jgi:hypothetical protein
VWARKKHGPDPITALFKNIKTAPFYISYSPNKTFSTQRFKKPYKPRAPKFHFTDKSIPHVSTFLRLFLSCITIQLTNFLLYIQLLNHTRFLFKFLTAKKTSQNSFLKFYFHLLQMGRLNLLGLVSPSVHPKHL